MNPFQLLLSLALVAVAPAACCWAFDVDRPSHRIAEVAALESTSERLPPTSVEAAVSSEPSSQLDRAAASSSDVSTVAYEEEFAYDEFEPAPPETAPVNPKATRLFESTWYSRVDYFYWAEQVDDAPFMENNGAMPTLGWQQRRGQQRYRAELFGGRVDYFADMGGLDASNVTDYLGLRGEYELMWEPASWEKLSFFGGIGTRFFVRSIPDIVIPGFVPNQSILIDGYQESWWTFYPYVGAESRRTMKPGWEPYWRARIGVTAFTREHVALDDVTMFPRANLTGQVELGFRGPKLFVSGFFEVMAWSRSPQVLGYDGQPFTAYQPDSQNVQVGLKSGLSY